MEALLDGVSTNNNFVEVTSSAPVRDIDTFSTYVGNIDKSRGRGRNI